MAKADLHYRQGNIVFSSETMEDLVMQVITHNEQQANGLSTDYGVVHGAVTRALKRGQQGLPQNKAIDAPRAGKNKRFDFRKLVDGAKSILATTLFDRVVSMEEMKRRAAICSRCELASRGTDCASCRFGGEIGKMLLKLRGASGKQNFGVPNVKNTAPSQMGCEYCGCLMLMKLPVQMRDFHEPEEENKGRPEHCWALRDGENFVEDPD